jgi:hypothetical protein
MHRNRERLFQLGSIAIGIAGFLVLAEILLRFLPVASGLSSRPVTAESPVFRFSSDRDFVFSKGWNLDMVNHGHVNNDGWVNDQDYHSDDSSPLVAVVGDSFVEAAMVPYAQTFHGLIANFFRDKFRVYSFGASGAPLSQYLISARYAVQQFKARALVINVVGNDFDESYINYKAAPGFWYYAPDPTGRLQLRLVEYRPGPMRSIVRHSALMRYLAINIGVAYLTSLNWMGYYIDYTGEKLPPHYAGFTLADPEPARVAASKLAVDAFLRDLHDIGLPARCVAFTVDGFRYPELSKKEAGTFFDILRKYFREQAEARAYEVIDLDPVFFLRYRTTSERFEYPNDGHWNAAGHAVVAEALKSSRTLTSSCNEIQGR